MENYRLTQGNLMKHLICLAVPLIIGNILQQFYNTIDALVLGRFASEGEFAAVGVSASVMNLFLFAIVGACTGISVIFAQLYGAEDLRAFRTEHYLVLIFGAILTVCVGMAGVFGASFLLDMIRTPGEIAVYAGSYLRIVLAALPFSFVYNFYSAMLRAIGRPRVPLFILALASGLNLVLDLVFVIFFGWGIQGAAWATAAAQAFSAILCGIYLKLYFKELLFRKGDCRLDRGLLRKTAHYSFVTSLQQTGLYIGKLLVQGSVNTAGTSVISAYTATTRIEGFINSFGDSGAAATSVLAAQNVGAGKKERVRKSFFCSFILMLLFGLLSSAVLYCTAGIAAEFLLGTGEGKAYAESIRYIHVVAAFYVFCYVGSTFAGYFDGCGKMIFTFLGSASHIALRAVLSWMWIGKSGLVSVAYATGIGWILVNLFWGVYYLRGRKKGEF